VLNQDYSALLKGLEGSPATDENDRPVSYSILGSAVLKLISASAFKECGEVHTMSVNSESGILYDFNQARIPRGRPFSQHPTVLLVEDQEEIRRDLRQIMAMNGYRLIDTDNGRDAVKRARNAHPDLLMVDLDVPLLYGLVAARQIIKKAQLDPVPVVIVTHEDTVDPYPMMEMGVRSNEYVTRLDDYEQLGNLLNYLLPIRPEAA